MTSLSVCCCILQVYLVFACSILEQDLMFVVYNIPTVGICRAEQRAKACQKLGVNFSDVADAQDGAQPVFNVVKQNGASTGAFGALQQQQQNSRKRPAGQAGWDNGMVYQDPLMGGDMAAAAAAAMAAGGDPNMGMPMQVCVSAKCVGYFSLRGCQPRMGTARGWLDCNGHAHAVCHLFGAPRVVCNALILYSWPACV